MHNFLRTLIITSLCCFFSGFPANAQDRIVVIGPELVEIVYRLGAGQKVVATDKHSTKPDDVKGKNTLGYFRSLSAEGIISQNPDLILITPDAGPPETLELLKNSGIQFGVAPRIKNPSEVSKLIEFVGKNISMQQQSAKLGAEYDLRLNAARSEKKSGVKAIFLMAFRGGTPIAAGKDTVPQTLVEYAGGINPAGFSGFKPLTPEAMIKLAPDVIIMMPDRIKAAGGELTLKKIPGISSTRAGKELNFLKVPASDILRLGPGTPEAIGKLKAYFEKISIGSN